MKNWKSFKTKGNKDCWIDINTIIFFIEIEPGLFRLFFDHLNLEENNLEVQSSPDILLGDIRAKD